MMLKFLFLGKTKESYLDQGITDFCSRLQRFVKVEIKIIKQKRKGGKEPEAKIKEETGRLLLANISRSSFVVALDPGGRQLTSEKLAETLTSWENQGIKSVVFIIGGELGLSREVLDKSDTVLSLSRMTFTHEMTRLLLLEQLYRAYTINTGTGYHK